MGGVRWIPKEHQGEYKIHKDLPVKPKRYSVYLVNDPNDYTQAKGQCWLIDKEYVIDHDIDWLPSNFEKDFMFVRDVGLPKISLPLVSILGRRGDGLDKGEDLPRNCNQA